MKFPRDALCRLSSVIILAGEMLKVAEAFLYRNMHPRVVVSAYMKALETAEKVGTFALLEIEQVSDLWRFALLCR